MRFPRFNKTNFEGHLPEFFSPGGLWIVARKLSKRGGRKVLTTAFTLYFCLKDSETPAWAKSVIVGALGYLIFPMDFIPDAILGAGFTDDWSVILGAMGTVMAHIKDEHKSKASGLSDRFLGKETDAQVDDVSLTAY
ncbi:MAG: YkvA family protein [Luteolibacter sp.]